MRINVRSANLASMAQRRLESNSSFPPVLPCGIYDRSISLPPGISNGANLCYAISVAQCLLNHSTFRGLLEELCAFHGHHCVRCLSKGMILLTTKETIHLHFVYIIYALIVICRFNMHHRSSPNAVPTV